MSDLLQCKISTCPWSLFKIPFLFPFFPILKFRFSAHNITLFLFFLPLFLPSSIPSLYLCVSALIFTDWNELRLQCFLLSSLERETLWIWFLTHGTSQIIFSASRQDCWLHLWILNSVHFLCLMMKNTKVPMWWWKSPQVQARHPCWSSWGSLTGPREQFVSPTVCLPRFVALDSNHHPFTYYVSF